MRKLFEPLNINRGSRDGDNAVLAKSMNMKSGPAPRVLKGKDSLMDRIKMVKALVEQNLGKHENEVECVRDSAKLEWYIDEAIKNKIAAVDTETTGLDSLSDIIVGPCLYTPEKKSIYVPVEHISYVTGIRVENQIPAVEVAKQFKRLADEKVNLVYHNAKFDYKFFLNNWGIRMPIYWDTMIGGFMLNENIPNGLKYRWELHCGQGNTELSMNFDDLFKDLDFRYVPLQTATLYAGMDPKKTFELFEFEENLLCTDMPGCKEKGLQKVSWVFHNIEMPAIEPLANMETRGIGLDVEYAKELEEEYNEQLKIAEDDFYKTLEMYRPEINAYKRKHPGEIIEPIQIGSPKQIGILLFKVLGLGDASWGTGEGVLKNIDSPVAKRILDYRGVTKILSTYVTKLPKVRHARDGKIHCDFNQIGAATGRLSSRDPNLQNIPARKGKKIRRMFVPDPGYVLVSCDFSQQEPRILAHMSNDKDLLQAYADDKDIYATMGSIVYGVPYDQCREKHPDGSDNPDGKKRRDSMKTLVLGIMYERGPQSVSDDLKCSMDEAKKLIKKFFDAFPTVRDWIEKTHEFVTENGYAEDAFGRKRRLVDAQLPDYTLEMTNAYKNKNFDPMEAFRSSKSAPKEIDPELEKDILGALRNAYGHKKVNDIKAEAAGMGVKVHDNTGKRADALRQGTNFRIQGSAASQTKLAMGLVERDPELKELGFQLLLQVHDELIGQAPLETAKKAGERMSHIMRHCADKVFNVKFKCDLEYTDRWYGEKVEV